MKILEGWDYMNLDSETIRVKNTTNAYVSQFYAICLDPREVEDVTDQLIQLIQQEYLGGE